MKRSASRACLVFHSDLFYFVCVAIVFASPCRRFDKDTNAYVLTHHAPSSHQPAKEGVRERVKTKKSANKHDKHTLTDEGDEEEEKKQQAKKTEKKTKKGRKKQHEKAEDEDEELKNKDGEEEEEEEEILKRDPSAIPVGLSDVLTPTEVVKAKRQFVTGNDFSYMGGYLTYRFLVHNERVLSPLRLVSSTSCLPYFLSPLRLVRIPPFFLLFLFVSCTVVPRCVPGRVASLVARS